MCTSSFFEENVTVEVNGEPRKVLMRTPKRLSNCPALLINLMANRQEALRLDGFRIVPDIFLAAGHRVASFDLPNHGERANRFGDGLSGMAKEVESGNDVFADIRETGRTFIDYAIKNRLVAGGAIVLNGTSRGGLAVLHLMAGDERVLAGAINVPVTYLPTLAEFSELADNEIIRRSNAESLVKELADRAIFITMGETDARVSAESCFRFYAKLCAASKKNQPVFFPLGGETHAIREDESVGYYASAAFLLHQCACYLRNDRQRPHNL